MNTKFLLIALSVAAFSSCTTAYKSGQTPDDVYYSPVKYVDEKQNDNRDEARNDQNDDISIRMSTRDRRWREFDEDYRYNNSPYKYCTCECTNYGYYYNPYYHPWPVYSTKIIPVNTAPRKVNLNSYSGLNTNTVSNPKTGNGINWVKPSPSYNNSNNSGMGNLIRQVISPTRTSSNSNNNSNNSRTYSPTSSNSSSGSSNSSSGNSSEKVSRPKRGG